MELRPDLDEMKRRALAAYGYALGRHQSEVITPALILDLDAAQRNIERMAAELRDLPAGIRPHFKAHKSPDLAVRQMGAGAVGMATATIWEAMVVAEAGITDIFLVNELADGLKIDLAAELARSMTFRIAVDDPENAALLSRAAARAGSTIGVMLEVDTGMGRAGTTTVQDAVALARSIAELPGLRLDGLTGYEGHCSLIHDDDQRHEAQRHAMDVFGSVADAIEGSGIPLGILSAGGTATWRWTAGDSRVTEIQAGTYVLMDTEYASMSPTFEHALTIEATVISRAGGRVVLDSGSKAISDGTQAAIVGRALPVERVDEEHGIFDGTSAPDLRVGDRLSVIPGYAPGTVNLFDAYLVTSEGTVIDIWPIVPRGAGPYGLGTMAHR